jgi:hypothetical protein
MPDTKFHATQRQPIYNTRLLYACYTPQQTSHIEHLMQQKKQAMQQATHIQTRFLHASYTPLRAFNAAKETSHTANNNPYTNNQEC